MARKDATMAAFTNLRRELKRDLPNVDADRIAWHLTIPQHIDLPTKTQSKPIYPHSDTLTCVHCQDSITLPLKTPRFNENTLHAYKNIVYQPLSPQGCLCENLKCIIDSKGIPTIYLHDRDMDSFQFHSGPIDLRIAQESDSAHINTLRYSPRPKTKDPFHYESRGDIMVNHVNLYRNSPEVIASLLPYQDLHSYSRAFNIVLYLQKTIIFPTGHEFTYKQLELPDNLSYSTLNASIYTERRAEELNNLTNFILKEVLPQAIDDKHHNLANKIAKRLKIPRTYAPCHPHTPYFQRLGCAVHGYPKDKDYPLTTYRDLHILRLPMLINYPKTEQFDMQEFYFKRISSNKFNMCRPLYISKVQLTRMKNERIRTVQYMLPRRNLSSHHTLLSYFQEHLKYLTIYPHTPIKHTL